MTRWLFLGLLLVSLSVAVWYAYLGGFRNPYVQLTTTTQPIYLAGRYFEGKASSAEFGPLFRQAQQVLDNGQLRGSLGNIYYSDPEASDDTVRAFIGLVVADTVSQKLPADYRYRTFPAGQRVVQARIEASYMVAPDKLYSGVKNFMQKQKLTSAKTYLEQFPTDAPAEVLAVVK
ncbi:hypothetical protein MUN82_17835 [Hymenobacter aerilatus]|uniref:GyrI-like small molecule binding domain-containing protein n=1 Tax=Hymenobacter aerilatus TaxID=2932251 RepID=A0A8T9SRQ8_9BACT|nr:hypothetical protein [Hymenobacter aerilatus]UOR04792.1 hypothetical protein MUN82_17835 [Hymenobacter aerilatus]